MVSHAGNYSLVQQKHFSFGQTKVLRSDYPMVKGVRRHAFESWGGSWLNLTEVHTVT